MAGEIISERRATSNRNGGRDHPAIPGDFRRNPQSIASFNSRGVVCTPGACFLRNRRVVALATALAAVRPQFIFTLIHRGLQMHRPKRGSASSSALAPSNPAAPSPSAAAAVVPVLVQADRASPGSLSAGRGAARAEIAGTRGSRAIARSARFSSSIRSSGSVISDVTGGGSGSGPSCGCLDIGVNRATTMFVRFRSSALPAAIEPGRDPPGEAARFATGMSPASARSPPRRRSPAGWNTGETCISASDGSRTAWTAGASQDPRRRARPRADADSTGRDPRTEPRGGKTARNGLAHASRQHRSDRRGEQAAAQSRRTAGHCRRAAGCVCRGTGQGRRRASRAYQQGEDVPLPGKPPTLKELGITPAHARYAMAMASLTEEQFERFLVFAQPSRRQEYGRMRRFLHAEAKRRPASRPTD